MAHGEITKRGELILQFPNASKELMADALHECLVGGNSLASGLGSVLEGHWEKWTLEEASEKFEREKSISYQTYEMFVAWRCAMNAAQALRATGEVDLPSRRAQREAHE